MSLEIWFLVVVLLLGLALFVTDPDDSCQGCVKDGTIHSQDCPVAKRWL